VSGRSQQDGGRPVSRSGAALAPTSDKTRTSVAVSDAASPRVTRHTPRSDVPASAYTVLGAGSRLRTVVIVSCPFCGEAHQHTAPATFVTGSRRAACRQGSYEITMAVAP
jgi:hypothetical protein